MNPKMTVKDAAEFLKISSRNVYKRLLDYGMPFTREGRHIYFSYTTARYLFNLSLKPKIVALQIVKGGTGKTSLACALAVRANLYGLRVLCIDLDQQGNLTSSFGVEAESLPVMVDILAEGYKYEEAITRVYPGMDILASRIENALLDDVIKLKKWPLNKVYSNAFKALREQYDLIVIDCPPNLGQSVAAVTLAVDQVIAPVVAESYAISGLKATRNAIKELEENFHTKIPLSVVVNKYTPRTMLSPETKQILYGCPVVHASEEFPTAVLHGESLFDTLKPTAAKRDVDALLRVILGIDQQAFPTHKNIEFNTQMLETFA